MTKRERDLQMFRKKAGQRAHVAKRTVQNRRRANISRIKVVVDEDCEARIREIFKAGHKCGKELGLKEADFSKYKEIDAFPEM